MNARTCLTVSALIGCLSVALGAFGAHGLTNNTGTGFLEKKYADTEPKMIAGQTVPASYKYFQDFKTGVEYQMSHALALAITGLLILRQPSRSLSIAASCFTGGIFFFCGSLYLLVLAGPRWLGIPWGAITPIGGVLMIIGWLSLSVGAFASTTIPTTCSEAKQHD